MACELRRMVCESAMEPHEQMQLAIMLEIERYLAVNGSAADSAEGVRAWWLSPQMRAVPLEHVIAALDRLETHGVVAKRSVGLGFIYARARHTGTRH
jgi:hypothetical protein